MRTYELVTIWRIAAPIESVWREIYHCELWPTWWRGVENVIKIQEGDAKGIGSIHRFTWRSRLPYSLTFEIHTVEVEPPVLLEGSARGELEGTGKWQLSQDGPETVVRYDWKVRTTNLWMRLLAPIAHPLFRWNHDTIMSWGAEGLARRLGVRVAGQRAL